MRVSSLRIAQFVVLAFMAGELSAAAADVLVLRSSGPSARHLPPGRRLPDNASFNLRPGDTVVILTGAGTRTFRGPGTFSASGQAQSGARAATGPRRNTGAVRAPPVPTQAGSIPSDVWFIDVTRGGRACVASGSRPRLWRPTPRAAVQLTITPPTGDPQTVAWPIGQALLAWPESVPISNGASYQLSWTGEPTPRRLTLRFVSPAASVETLGASLQANDCQAQLDIFIARQAVGEPASPAQPQPPRPAAPTAAGPTFR